MRRNPLFQQLCREAGVDENFGEIPPGMAAMLLRSHPSSEYYDAGLTDFVRRLLEEERELNGVAPSLEKPVEPLEINQFFRDFSRGVVAAMKTPGIEPAVICKQFCGYHIGQWITMPDEPNVYDGDFAVKVIEGREGETAVINPHLIIDYIQARREHDERRVNLFTPESADCYNAREYAMLAGAACVQQVQDRALVEHGVDFSLDPPERCMEDFINNVAKREGLGSRFGGRKP